MRLNIVLVVLALFGSATSFAAGSRDQELWDAAGRGDAATVRRLLAGDPGLRIGDRAQRRRCRHLGILPARPQLLIGGVPRLRSGACPRP